MRSKIRLGRVSHGFFSHEAASIGFNVQLSNNYGNKPLDFVFWFLNMPAVHLPLSYRYPIALCLNNEQG